MNEEDYYWEKSTHFFLVCSLILDTSGQHQTRYSMAHEFIDKGQIVLLAWEILGRNHLSILDKCYGNASRYLVYPTSNSSTTSTNNKLPAVIMIHENRDLNDNIRSL